MAQQPKLIRIKSLKMFKASIDGALPIMVNPGDVVDVDLFLAGMLIKSEKAELTEEKPRINKEYVAPPRPVFAGLDPLGALLRAVETLTKAMTVSAQKGH